MGLAIIAENVHYPDDPDYAVTGKPLEKILERARENACGCVDNANQNNFAKGDSPIEQILYLALLAEIDLGLHEIIGIVFVNRGESFSPSAIKGNPFTEIVPEPALIVESQADVEGCRVDFLIYPNARYGGLSHSHRRPGEHRLIVECDGHDYHERSKKDAARDRSRDRIFQEKGYTVFRFTGSEIHNDPCRCADQIIDWAVNKVCS